MKTSESRLADSTYVCKMPPVNRNLCTLTCLQNLRYSKINARMMCFYYRNFLYFTSNSQAKTMRLVS